MKLITVYNSAHWYTRDGRPVHEVQSKNGEWRPTTLRDARKMDLLPSVTSILQVLNKPQLEAWKQEQAILASLTLPRIEDESLDDFAKRAVKDAKEHTKNSADLGTQIHRAIEAYVKHKSFSNKMTQYLIAFQSCIDEYEIRIKSSENIIVNSDYAGTYDLIGMIGSFDKILIDVKSQDVKEKPVFYPEWCYQLEAYAMAYDGPLYFTANLIIDRMNPGKWYFKFWDADDRINSRQVFECAKAIWKIQKNYYPEHEAND